ncbi:MAG: hypothetical protein MJZ99_05785 [Bacteroidales bacterium]|nr:hypothetical protein [Bacteroidales bacterium]
MAYALRKTKDGLRITKERKDENEGRLAHYEKRRMACAVRKDENENGLRITKNEGWLAHYERTKGRKRRTACALRKTKDGLRSTKGRKRKWLAHYEKRRMACALRKNERTKTKDGLRITKDEGRLANYERTKGRKRRKAYALRKTKDENEKGLRLTKNENEGRLAHYERTKGRKRKRLAPYEGQRTKTRRLLEGRGYRSVFISFRSDFVFS